MSQPKPKRRRTPKPQLPAEEFALCERAINEYDDMIDERCRHGRLSEGEAIFYEVKLAEWYDTLLIRGGVTE